MALASHDRKVAAAALPPSASQFTLILRPKTGWATLDLREVWQFRDLLFTLALRDVKLRYRQTALGALWVLLQPLIAALIFTLVFDRVANLPSDGIDYFPFSFASLLAWNAFSGTLVKSSGCLVGNAHLISKIYFPRLVLPFSSVFGTLIDLGVGLALMAVLMVYYGIVPHVGILLLPLWLLLILMLALGVGLFAAALTVSYRDIQYVLPVLTQFVLYASPIAYAVSAVPASVRPFYFLNPLSGLLEAFRWSLLGTDSLRWQYVGYSAVFSVAILFVGSLVFKRMERRFADVI